MSRFDLINLETNLKVNNLIELGFLLDLVVINNHHSRLLKVIERVSKLIIIILLMATKIFFLIKLSLT